MLSVTFSGPVIVEALPDGRALSPDSRQRPAHRREGRGPDLHRQRADRLHRADPVNWVEQLEVLHAAGGRRESEDFVAAVCGALA